MNTLEFLSKLRNLEINLTVEGSRLICKAPEGRLTPQLRDQISQRKAEILAFFQRANRSISETPVSLKPISRAGNLPLSFAQQRLWFLDRLVPNNPFYNMPTAVRLTGEVNIEVLEAAFNEIKRRHEGLRTCFPEGEGQGRQEIQAHFSLPIHVLNLQNLSPPEQEKQLERMITQEALRPFNLATGPLLRISLIQLSESEHLLMLNMHHIISDGWSIGVLIQELGILYSAFVQGKSSPLPELGFQYADFAHWQREWLQGEILEHQLAYWRQQLEGIAMLNLPSDRPRPAVPSYRGKRYGFRLSQAVSQKLNALTQGEGVTLFMTLLAAFQTLLYRYSQQEDITVGSPIANRNRSEIEPLIGFFVNSLVLRTDLSGNPTFREVLARVKQVALGAYAHQDVPFEKLVEELHPERSLNHNPLFQVAFALQNAPMQGLELPGLTLSPQPLEAGTARFDLELHLWEQSSTNPMWVDSREGISGFVIYSTDLFEESTIGRLVAHFQTLLEAIVANPDQRIGDLPLLSEAERDQLLVQWNQTEVDYPQELAIHQLVEIQAAEHPEKVALVCGNQTLTYGELNRRSNQLAHYLQKLGVGVEVVVGLCLDRTLDMAVAMLGILKAGGAYLPLDPSVPSSRLNRMLTEAKVPVLLTQQSNLSLFNRVIGKIVCLDTDKELINRERDGNLSSHVTSNSLAYVIYTSGSTGEPKGVEIEQKSLLNLTYWHQQAFAVSASDRSTQVAGVAFDACGWEIWPYLTAGACIYIVDSETRRSPEKLRDWLVENAITISFLPTPLAEKVLQLTWPEQTQLRLLLTGGETLHQHPLPSHPFQVVNNYGPTENTVVTTSGRVPVGNGREIAPGIGKAVANTQLYVCDRYFHPVPIGIPGELYIGGDGLARGYRHHPELTAEAFIRNPFHPEPGKFLYKTGDLVRYQPDGSLEFLGRLDQQVKIRGFRIELGEIEVILAQHPAVNQTLVTASDNDRGETQLTAYLALNLERVELAELNPIALQEEQIQQWQILYNETYKMPAVGIEPSFNIVGWNSSYTGEPIPAAEMREWVDHQAAQILAFNPNQVLEVGCGTGLLLFRIAPHCTEYCGTDFSPPSLNFIRQHLGKYDLKQVTLLEKLATDFEGIAPQSFDTVILNSIVQYFPSLDYLIQTISGAVTVTKPGGRIFLGDLRSLPLLKAFYTDVELTRAQPCVTRPQLQQRVEMQLFQEVELALDPAFFTALKSRLPQIETVEIQLMRGQSQNELTQFRYNAILHLAGTDIQAKSDNNHRITWLNQGENREDWTVNQLRQYLIETHPDICGLSGVPNSRIMAAVQATEWLFNSSPFKTAGQLKKAVQRLPNSGINPEDWYGLELPYRVYIRWSASSSEGRYDVVFVREDITDFILEASSEIASDSAYANNPLQGKAARQFVPELREYLSEKLPDYMIPSAFVVLESLPLTPNGKVDRRALPTATAITPQLAGNYTPPRTVIEERLVQIWAEVLGIKQVGIYDNFFELGGHSLLATQLASRVRDKFEFELPLRSVFEAPTIAQLAPVIQELQQHNSTSPVPALVPVSRERRRMKLSSLNPKNQS
ncbi:non-ribosomal peptide synthetase [Laspinema olomoucense]|uniref:Amino acid adenylation domain-containing protein n=1 Tax=Laspinema olomoucense D3b TaxID=2953688 RepID=A0ABT2N8L8_9CYAN|nr:non-ribosomal peptide synthetase [Laspinema sp. D3b]MCT7979017.1 amino acid adenylation domain-containing protein [Laspinema sp. D3b]